MHHKCIFLCVTIGCIICGCSIINPSCCTEGNEKDTEVVSEFNLENANTNVELQENEQVIDEKYYKILNELTADTLWDENDGYDACHGMMIPMHYAFSKGNQRAIAHFDELFTSFVRNNEYGDIEKYSLSQGHFIYLASEYLRLSIDSKKTLNESQIELKALAYKLAQEFLFETKAIYGLENTVIEHINAILNGKIYSKRFHSGINDAELFNLAIMCDLYHIDLLLGQVPDEYEKMSVEVMYKVLTDSNLNITTDGDGWIFQPGVWSDHKDFMYAGNSTIEVDLEENMIEDLAWDTSHFHRMPAFLNSLISAQTESEKIQTLNYRKKQLANQLMLYVLKEVDGYWYTTTFMDGRMGVYRYNPDTGDGYEGYELSSTFFAGWWVLLGDERISSVYSDMLTYFPLKNDESNPYRGLDTSDDQNPYLRGNSAWEKGWFEFIVWCAEKL